MFVAIFDTVDVSILVRPHIGTGNVLCYLLLHSILKDVFGNFILFCITCQFYLLVFMQIFRGYICVCMCNCLLVCVQSVQQTQFLQKSIFFTWILHQIILFSIKVFSGHVGNIRISPNHLLYPISFPPTKLTN